jgi:hypothetical protein
VQRKGPHDLQSLPSRIASTSSSTSMVTRRKRKLVKFWRSFLAKQNRKGATPKREKNVQLTDSRPHPHWAGRAAAHMTRFAFAYAVLGVVLLSMGGPSGAALLSPSAELCRGAQLMSMAGVCIGRPPPSLPLSSASEITGIHLPLSALRRAVRMAPGRLFPWRAPKRSSLRLEPLT